MSILMKSVDAVERWSLRGKTPGGVIEEGVGFRVGWSSVFNYYNCIAVGTSPFRKKVKEGDVSFLKRVTGNGHMISLHKIEYKKGKSILKAIDKSNFFEKEIFTQLVVGAFWTFKSDFVEELNQAINNLSIESVSGFIQLLENNPGPYMDKSNRGGYYLFARVKKLHLFKQEKAEVFKQILEDDVHNRLTILNVLILRQAYLKEQESILKKKTTAGEDFSSLFVNNEWECKFDEVLCRLLHPVERTPLLKTITKLKEDCRKSGEQRKFEKPDNTDWQLLYLISCFMTLGAFNTTEFNKIVRVYYKKVLLSVPKNMLSSFDLDYAREKKVERSPKKDLMAEIDGFIKCVCD